MLPWRHHNGGDECYHGYSTRWRGVLPLSTMGEMGVTMETVQWGRWVLPWTQYIGGQGMLSWRQHNGGEWCYHGDSTMEDNGVTIETVRQHSGREDCYHGTVGERRVQWVKYIGGEGCHHGVSTVGERDVIMETVQWGRGVLPWSQYNGGERFLPSLPDRDKPVSSHP